MRHLSMWPKRVTGRVMGGPVSTQGASQGAETLPLYLEEDPEPRSEGVHHQERGAGGEMWGRDSSSCSQ